MATTAPLRKRFVRLVDDQLRALRDPVLGDLVRDDDRRHHRGLGVDQPDQFIDVDIGFGHQVVGVRAEDREDVLVGNPRFV
jgi:hypothetical protein